MFSYCRLIHLHEVYQAVVCTTKTSVEDPLLAPSGRNAFLVIEEGHWRTVKAVGLRAKRMAPMGSLKPYAWFLRRLPGPKWRMESKAAAEAKATATAPEENLSSKKGKETVI